MGTWIFPVQTVASTKKGTSVGVGVTVGVEGIDVFVGGSTVGVAVGAGGEIKLQLDKKITTAIKPGINDLARRSIHTP
jgi:hypothetical protein